MACRQPIRSCGQASVQSVHHSPSSIFCWVTISPPHTGTGQWFRFCVLLSQLHRLPDGPGRAGDGLRVRVYFLPFGCGILCGNAFCRWDWHLQPARFGSGRCSLPYKAPVQKETSSFSSTSSFLSPFILSQICPRLNTLFYFHILLTLLLSCVIMIAQNCSNRNSFQDRRKEKADGRDDAGLPEGNRLHAV